MAKAELGVKRRCLSCSAPFFDLNRTPIVCPKCAAVFQVIEVVRSSTKYSPARRPDFKRPAPAAPVETENVLLADDEEEAVLLADEEEDADAAAVEPDEQEEQTSDLDGEARI